MNNKNSDFQITPETKISALLGQFPQLEEVLMKMAPEFKKLRNPILRKTIAKVASLHQVAALFDNSPSLKRGDSSTYTPRGFRVWSSCFPVATKVSTPQADTECPSANSKYSSLRYKKQEKFAPYIPIAKVRGFTALSGKVPLPEMINTLRAEAGIQDLFTDDVSGMTLSKDKPSWFSESKITANLDIRPLLESGEQPIQYVLRECQILKPDEICEVISPFLPAPLIEQADKKGYLVWSKEESPHVYKTYFTPKNKS